MHRISKEALISSNVVLEDPVNITGGCEVSSNSFIGSYTYLNRDCKIYGNTSIGRFCSFGRDVHVGLHEHPIEWLSTHPFQYSDRQFKGEFEYDRITRKYWKDSKPVKIGSDVWIGTGAKICVGVSIGHGAIIAAGAIVTSDVNPYTIVGGVPSRVIRKRFSDEVIDRLLKVEWWNFPIHILNNIEFDKIDIALNQLEIAKNNEDL